MAYFFILTLDVFPWNEFRYRSACSIFCMSATLFIPGTPCSFSSATSLRLEDQTHLRLRQRMQRSSSLYHTGNPDHHLSGVSQPIPCAESLRTKQMDHHCVSIQSSDHVPSLRSCLLVLWCKCSIPCAMPLACLT